MSGTRLGGLKASEKNRRLHGEDFYRRIGQKGGRKSGIIKGFAFNIERAREAGRKGGLISKRTIVPNEDLIEAWNSGKSIDEISSFFGVSYDYVTRSAYRLRKQGHALHDRRKVA